ncbi:MAG: hypothetical protein LJE89_03780 [Deltaproteobacteria bacterium]|nr:hypothetical protein [Deltaproteobacteria bacterium]
MRLSKYMAFVLPGYLISVGLFFLITLLFDTEVFSADPPGKYFLGAIAAVFVVFGVVYLSLYWKEKLPEHGKSIVEVRKEAILNIKDESLLAKIATEDPNPRLREKARERLQEIHTEA